MRRHFAFVMALFMALALIPASHSRIRADPVAAGDPAAVIQAAAVSRAAT